MAKHPSAPALDAGLRKRIRRWTRVEPTGGPNNRNRGVRYGVQGTL